MDTASTLNQVLQLAGVDPADAKVLSCKRGDSCTVEFSQKNRQTKKTFPTAGELFSFVNQWLQLNRNAAKNKLGSTSPLFKPLGEKWVLVDHDKLKGADGVLYYSPLSPRGWQYVPGDLDLKGADSRMINDLLQLGEAIPPQAKEHTRIADILRQPRSVVKLIEYLASKDWKSLGLEASPEDFAKRNYGFDVIKTTAKTGASPVPFISPLHRVTLAGHPNIVVPWSDPYLLMEWETYLKAAGVEIKREWSSDIIAKSKYYYKSLLMMDSERIPPQIVRTANGNRLVTERIRFRFFSPLGKVEREMTVKARPKPPVRVTRHRVLAPAGRNFRVTHYKVSVYGRRFTVLASFPAVVPQKERLRSLQEIGEAMQMIPEAMLAPILDGVGDEKRLKIIYVDKQKARKLGWLRGVAGGNYDPFENTSWLEPRKHRIGIEDSVYHEVGGHAFADFSVSDNILASLTAPDQSALRDYYAWKLAQLFTPDELASYNKLSTHFRSWMDDPSRNKADKDKHETPLWPFRDKAKQRFISKYAVEGSRGIDDQVREPSEDFAEVMEVFYRALGGRADWGRVRAKEPLLNLVGLNYLFRQYKVAKIGNIERKEVLSFSKQAFSEVLGIDLENIDSRYGAHLKVFDSWNSNRLSGVIVPVRVGYRSFPIMVDGQNDRADGMTAGIGVGYMFRSKAPGFIGGIGLLFDFTSGQTRETGKAVTAFDAGGWARLGGNLGALDLFAEPAVGVRYPPVQESNGLSLWLGGTAGLAFLSGGLAVGQQFRFYPVEEEVGFGTTLQLDIPSLIRYGMYQAE